MPERALVIIPTYNEAANVPNLVPQVLCQDPRLEILIEIGRASCRERV